MTKTPTATPRAMPLRRNFSWTFVGNVVYAAAQWAMLTVLAKLGTKEMVGQFALGLAIAAPVITFTNLALRLAQATDARGEYQFRDYLALRLSMTLLGLLVIAGIVAYAGYGGQAALVILMMGLAKACEAISDVFFGLFQLYERMDRMATSMMLKGVLSLTALSLGVALTHTVFWGVVGLASAWLLLLLFYDIPMGRRTLRELPKTDGAGAAISRAIRPRWRWKTLGVLFRLTLPLGCAMMFIVLSANIPRYFVERLLGQGQLGIFAAMAYVMFAGSTVVGALGQSASPRLARYYAQNDMAGYKSLLRKLTGIGAAIGILCVLLSLIVGRPLLTLLYTPEYANRLDVFVWLNVAATLGYIASCLGFGMTAARSFKSQPFIYGFASVVSMVACFLLIPRFGLLGSAWALTAMNLAQLLVTGGCLAFTIHQKLQEPPMVMETAQ